LILKTLKVGIHSFSAFKKVSVKIGRQVCLPVSLGKALLISVSLASLITVSLGVGQGN